MPQIIVPKKGFLNQFDGGLAQDARTFSTNQYSDSANFDMLKYSHYLEPYVDLTNEAMGSGTIDDSRITDVSSMTTSGTTWIIGLGKGGAGSNNVRFFKKDSSSDVTTSWTSYATGSASVVAGTLAVYKSKGYCIRDNSTQHILVEWDGSATASDVASSSGILGGYGTSLPRPFEHPEDKVLYMASGNVVSKFDGSTFTPSAFTLPTDKVITSLTNYGTYLVIVCKPKNGAGNSTMYFWGRSTTITTAQAVFDLGVGDAQIVENIENNLVIVMTSSSVGSYSTTSTRYLYVKTYSGGTTPTLYTLPISSLVNVNNLKMKFSENLYFGFGGDTALYRFGKNKDGAFSLNRDLAFPESGIVTVQGISKIGDIFWLGYFDTNGVYKLKRSKSPSETASYSTEANFTTTYNPSMALDDRYRKKKMIAVQVSFTGATNGTGTLYLSVDGSAMKSCLTSTATGEQMLSTTAYTDGTKFKEGSEFQFKFTSTGNVKLKEIRYRYETLNNQDL